MVTAGPARALAGCTLFFFLGIHDIKKSCILRHFGLPRLRTALRVRHRP